MRVYEGHIVTCDARDTVARFLAEDRGRIEFVGDEPPAELAGAERIALGERALLPAFADTHIHFSSYALFSGGLDVRAARNFDELAATLRDYLARHDDKIVIGFGASRHSVVEKRLVSREELDAIEPKRPLFIVKYDGHACIVSSSLLAMLPPAIQELRGFHADTGELNQEACFAAIDFVTSRFPVTRLLRSMVRGFDRLAARGIGMMHAVEGVGFPRDLDVDLMRLVARGQSSGFQTRVFFQTLDPQKVLRRKLPRIGGCFATALDGCFGSEDAALLAPYSNDAGNRGVQFYSDAKLFEFAKKANRAGLQIEVHAIGDAAFEQAVRMLVAALADFPREDHRHTIIHACLPTEQGLDACARHKIGIALQPAFLDWPLEPLPYLESILGDRAQKISPLRDMLSRGVIMSGGSDAPCTLPDAIAGIHAACNHYVAGQSLPVQDALKLFTANAAWMSFDEKERGTLEKGKVADLVVLNRNPLSVPAAQLKKLQVVELLLGGRPYPDGQSVPGVVFKGLFSRGARL